LGVKRETVGNFQKRRGKGGKEKIGKIGETVPEKRGMVKPEYGGARPKTLTPPGHPPEPKTSQKQKNGPIQSKIKKKKQKKKREPQKCYRTK